MSPTHCSTRTYTNMNLSTCKALSASQRLLRKKKMLSRFVVLNLPWLLLFFCFVPCYGIAVWLLPSSLVVSKMVFFCTHTRAPQWPWFAAAAARLISTPWKEDACITPCTADLSEQSILLITPAAWHPATQSWSWELLAWAIFKSNCTNATAPLSVVTMLPDICNAPVLRLLFQACGWHDFRCSSVSALVCRGHDLLLFNEKLTELQLKKMSTTLLCRCCVTNCSWEKASR